ncbi:unnamed protein product [Symbiodinium natans]|uniref:Uncharacterized protein n=1 Tax=Symbiodinium natans TaxID=878477 RepID=A0A812T9U0_9DINO|nr:unnamed protein product [Symbiodinium natans]
MKCSARWRHRKREIIRLDDSPSKTRADGADASSQDLAREREERRGRSQRYGDDELDDSPGETLADGADASSQELARKREERRGRSQRFGDEELDDSPGETRADGADASSQELARQREERRGRIHRVSPLDADDETLGAKKREGNAGSRAVGADASYQDREREREERRGRFQRDSPRDADEQLEGNAGSRDVGADASTCWEDHGSLPCGGWWRHRVSFFPARVPASEYLGYRTVWSLVLSRKLPPMNRRYQDREREREERLLGLDSHCRRLQA